VLFLILSLIIMVAAFNIISGMIMLVKEKGRDIAILRTVGATRGTIMRIFFMSGAAIGVTGTLLGFILGILFAQNIETIQGWIEGLTGADLFAAEVYFLSLEPADPDRDAGCPERGRHGTCAVPPRHPLSSLAGGQSRSRGGASL